MASRTQCRLFGRNLGSNQEVPSYQGNPLIEALPPILDVRQASSLISHYPKFDSQERLLPAHVRLHLIQSALRFFVALPVHIDLEQRFSRMIRVGYQGRNPALSTFWGDVNTRLALMGKREWHFGPPRPVLPSWGSAGWGRLPA